MPTSQNLEQKRASYAWIKVQETKTSIEDYRKLVKGAPALVMSNGLMQTLAYYQSRNDGQGKKLVIHLAEWLKQQKNIGDGSFDSLMKALYGSNNDSSCSARYMEATREALELLRWLRQLADAV